MFSKNSYRSFYERPEYNTEQFFFRLPILIPKIPERLLHGFAKLFSKNSWIESEKFLIKRVRYCLFIHKEVSGKENLWLLFLIAVRKANFHA